MDHDGEGNHARDGRSEPSDGRHQEPAWDGRGFRTEPPPNPDPAYQEQACSSNAPEQNREDDRRIRGVPAALVGEAAAQEQAIDDGGNRRQPSAEARGPEGRARGRDVAIRIPVRLATGPIATPT